MKNLLVNTKLLTIILFLLFLLPSCNNEEIFVVEESAIVVEETEPTEEEDAPNTEDEVIPIDVVDDTVTTTENIAVDLEPYLNDENLPQTITISNTNPSNGVLTINDNSTPNNFLDDSIVYTPNAGFSGIDSFDYTVCDASNSENCDTATVTITVEAVIDDIETELKAFPGAEGYGKNAVGGRGGRIIKVTNLNNSGSGSFRAACEASGSRIVVFEIGGRINLTSTVTINDPFITIAGQTAPGDGITLSMEGTPNEVVLQVQANDVIIRYLTIRRSESEVSEQNSDCLVITSCHDVIVDHCSFSWASDENIAIYDYDGNNRANVYNVTIQNSLIDTAWGGIDKGIICSGGVDRLTFYNLVFASVGQRQPLIKNETGNYANEETYFEIINTVTLEGKWHASFPNNIAAAGTKHLNYINNLCIDSGFSRNMLFVDTAYPVSIFTQGNISPLRTSITSPVNWDEEWSVIQAGGGQDDVEKRLTTDYRVTTPKSTPIINDGVVLTKAVNLVDSLKDHVGASYPTRDSEDTRAINDVVTRTSTAANTSGTFPILDSGTPLTDSDNDGMSDAWEDANGYNKNIDDSLEDRDGDGYTNIEEFLNRTLD
ncbi:MAG: Ig-like domain-containing protein [Algibacter sp.]|uniref:Ig-like domain-containing protein n=1 Tax=Algibacter sp. TaxID=1872428 RepID=UPI002602B101|nr:Ig-like domain-containing protein [Algibacter sp.]MDG1730896.1 Ig-like domain-containing protein [Algibacter sp.]MDG2179398.1 Ig-like domain-containing protein [Algibacter sp.]